MTDFVDRTGRSTVTLVLRAAARAAGEGLIVGHAEVVDTGEVVPLHGIDDLVALVRRLAG